MPGDPQECREHAAHCRELAATAGASAARKLLSALPITGNGLLLN
jgi:hypothetical protein